VTSLVFDTTALSHFARANRIDELQIAVAEDEPVLLAEVAAELVRGIPSYPSLGSAAAGGWLKQVELQELPELAAFARYKGELGGGPERNNGEAAVLAWVSVNGGIAIIDEVVARAIGNRERLQVHGSLWLLIRGFRTRTRSRHGRGHRGRPHSYRDDAPAGQYRRGSLRLGLRGWNSVIAA
jgi:predicted nucleic acid-binding protein